MKTLDGQDTLALSDPLESVIVAGRRVHASTDVLDALIAARLGVHRSDLRCLNLLEHGPLSASEVGQRLSLSSGSITALIDRLERVGLAQRQRSTTDRRAVEVALTPSAFQRVGPLYRQVAHAMRSAFEHAGPAEVRQAAATLNAFADALAVGVDRIQSAHDGPGESN